MRIQLSLKGQKQLSKQGLEAVGQQPLHSNLCLASKLRLSWNTDFQENRLDVGSPY